MKTLSDITLHIDEELTPESRADLGDKVKRLDGVAEVLTSEDKPHLAVVRYQTDQAKAGDILAIVRNQGLHAELIGL